MPHIDATPENTNSEECDVCKAQPEHPCTYSTNPPIARDRMHYQRVESAGLADVTRRRLRAAFDAGFSRNVTFDEWVGDEANGGK